ncbi:hypothetical protein Tco_0321701 [Tanacetum coccineum]
MRRPSITLPTLGGKGLFFLAKILECDILGLCLLEGMISFNPKHCPTAEESLLRNPFRYLMKMAMLQYTLKVLSALGSTPSIRFQSIMVKNNTIEEDEKKCMDVVDYLARQAKKIVIEKQGTVNCKGKAHVVAGKRRKRASGGIKRLISQRS